MSSSCGALQDLPGLVEDVAVLTQDADRHGRKHADLPPVSDDLVRRFDVDVSRGLAAIADAVTTLDGERMADQTEVFAAALQHNLIDAADFRT